MNKKSVDTYFGLKPAKKISLILEIVLGGKKGLKKRNSQ